MSHLKPGNAVTISSDRVAGTPISRSACSRAAPSLNNSSAHPAATYQGAATFENHCAASQGVHASQSSLISASESSRPDTLTSPHPDRRRGGPPTRGPTTNVVLVLITVGRIEAAFFITVAFMAVFVFAHPASDATFTLSHGGRSDFGLYTTTSSAASLHNATRPHSTKYAPPPRFSATAPLNDVPR